MKPCSKCHNPKDLSEFYNNRSTKDGKAGECKECADERQMVRRAKLQGKDVESLPVHAEIGHKKLIPVCPWSATVTM